MLKVSSPAKINLFLAVTGKRADGFHDLVSVVAQLDFGDELTVTACRAIAASAGGAAEFSLACDVPGVPTGADNLVLKAAQAFRAATNWQGGAHFDLVKRIPMGAGLGGGSSNAAAALKALNELAGRPLDPAALAAVAASVGSDCALFLHDAPVVMRGRGDRIAPIGHWSLDIGPSPAERLRGRRVLLFMPSFSVSTPWAYSRLAEMGAYLDAAAAERQLADWVGGKRPAEELLFNSLEAPVFEKYVALPILIANLYRDFDLAAGMSGSGSCCFALLPEKIPPARVEAAGASLRAALGPTALIREATIV